MLEIKSTELGAELISVKLNGQEKLHDGQSFWTGRAPILFPCVGRLKEDKTVINGKTYKMQRHGFARKSTFQKIDENAYLLISNEEIKKIYPYDFALYIKYEVEKDTLINKCKVMNKGNETMYFGLGFHPAFQCDYSNGEYYITFEKEEKEIKIKQIQAEDGYIREKEVDRTKHMKENKLCLTSNSFVDDAFVLTNMKSNKVTLVKKENPILTFDFTDFPYLGVWSKVGAPYVCLEPWFNTTDRVDSDGVFENKPDILKLEPKEEFECQFSVKFYE